MIWARMLAYISGTADQVDNLRCPAPGGTRVLRDPKNVSEIAMGFPLRFRWNRCRRRCAPACPGSGAQQFHPEVPAPDVFVAEASLNASRVAAYVYLRTQPPGAMFRHEALWILMGAAGFVIVIFPALY
jgi:hypothetical protein